ncbi:MAG: hypothetical protein O2913_12465 [Chloroflexi bacterium]|nr:hypothetical protein [Chloroflexota bacterium]
MGMGRLAYLGFTAVVVALGLIVLATGVGVALEIIEGDQETVWLDVALTLSTGVALLAGIYMIERSALLGGGLVVVGVIVIGVVTLWTIIIPVAMALLAMGALLLATRVARERHSLL